MDAFWKRVEKTDSCWLWTGSINNCGYGRVRDGYAHRAAFEQLRGPIPAGLTIDHLCNNRRCVNPDHLEPVTQEENLRRGRERRAQESHCKNGHPWAENLYVSGNGGYRRCRACAQEVDRRRTPRSRAVAS